MATTWCVHTQQKVYRNPLAMSATSHVQVSNYARYLTIQKPIGKSYNCNIMIIPKTKLDVEENQKVYKSNEE